MTSKLKKIYETIRNSGDGVSRVELLKSGMHNSTVYSAVKRLENEGKISAFHRNGLLYYRAINVNTGSTETKVENVEKTEIVHSENTSENRSKIELNKEVKEKLERVWGRGLCVTLVGPAGVGKTYIAETVAREKGYELYKINVSDKIDESELVGYMTIVGNETKFVDGILTRALLASQNKKVCVLFDEVNRCLPERISVLLSVTDFRCELCVLGDNKIVKGNRENLQFIATLNSGTDYAVYSLDTALKSRFGTVIRLNFGDICKELKAFGLNIAGLSKFVNNVREGYEKGELDYSFSLRELEKLRTLLDSGFTVEEAVEMMVGLYDKTVQAKVIEAVKCYGVK